MLWRDTVTAFVWLLALNRWLAERRPELQPPAQDSWQPPVIGPDGSVR